MLPLLMGGGMLGHRVGKALGPREVAPGEVVFGKHAGLGMLVGPVGAAYVGSAYLKNRRDIYGEPLTGTEDFLADNPLLTGVGASFALHKGKALLDSLGSKETAGKVKDVFRPKKPAIAR